MPDYVLVMTTCPPEDAESIGLKLVESKTCACANIIPRISSIYHWKEKIEHESEAIILLKTEKQREQDLWEELRKHHPYEVPEFVVVDIARGSKDYLQWISGSMT
ncbi:MAG: divalent-cation tolerance protein CutA [Candidatus Thorarchaeota archaeon]|nr:divalent-cation tolerance protein CutA [Candidatus Thorarchaeota archaeon]